MTEPHRNTFAPERPPVESGIGLARLHTEAEEEADAVTISEYEALLKQQRELIDILLDELRMARKPQVVVSPPPTMYELSTPYPKPPFEITCKSDGVSST